MQVWIVKYAMTQGIYEAEAEVCSEIDENMITVASDNGGYVSYFHKGDWFESKALAIVAANAMRDRKIKSLKKKIAKIEQLDFVSMVG